jgi:Cft2 family RNA processing exonuclease
LQTIRGETVVTSVRAISGLGGKGPACFLLETANARILFDLGEGPQPGLLPDIGTIGPVDALVLSHQHVDHAGALRFRPDIGNPPVYASAIVSRTLPNNGESKVLPLHGAAEVCGIKLTTGRSGHAPGGIWIHLAVGDGFIYMGDCCLESPLYAFDPPPLAGMVILDASYGDYEKPFRESQVALDRALDAKRVMLPVPAQGRGPEIALHLFRSGVSVALDEGVLAAARALTKENADCVKPEAMADLKRLVDGARAPSGDFSGITLCSPATLVGDLGECVIDVLNADGDARVVFTGYVAPKTPAESVMASGRGQSLRWNIHPRLSDNAALVAQTKARTVMPAFGDRKVLSSWEKAFAPARVVVEGAVEF